MCSMQATTQALLRWLHLYPLLPINRAREVCCSAQDLWREQCQQIAAGAPLLCLPFLVLFLNLETGHLIFSLELACFEKDIPPELGEDAVISMVYEANARLRDPVYGCVASVAALQLHASQLQQELASALTQYQTNYLNCCHCWLTWTLHVADLIHVYYIFYMNNMFSCSCLFLGT